MSAQPAPDYPGLARALWTWTMAGRSSCEISRLLGNNPQTLASWGEGRTPIRASTWLVLARRTQLPIGTMLQAVLAPQPAPAPPAAMTSVTARTACLGPWLRAHRGERTLAEAARLLRTVTPASLHHWESGRRDVPLHHLLRAVDRLGSRLRTLLDSIGCDLDPADFGLSLEKKDFSDRFFGAPWIPTVFLAVQTTTYAKERRHDDRKLARRLGLEVEHVRAALETLADLELVRFDGRHYRHTPAQHYAPPHLNPRRLEAMHEYWFSRAATLARMPGLHKIEEHALSRASAEKVRTWIQELRERIRLEVSRSEPETLIHVHWQLAELM